MGLDVTIEDVRAAQTRIAARIRRTPIWESPALSRLVGARTLIKCESLQCGGSFKLRGCLNKLMQLPEAALRAGIVTVSGGNHAIAVSLAAAQLGTRALVLMPQATPPLNIRLTHDAGGEVRLCADAAEAFAEAGRLAKAGMTFIHPYDDPAVIAGHGTLALELIEDTPFLPDHVLVSIGGGGFMAGLGAAFTACAPQIRLHGVETEGATAMGEALAAGRPVTIRPSSLARTLGAPFVTERTLAAAQAFLASIVTVPDAAAVEALFTILAAERLLVEPAASATLAAALARRDLFGPGETVALILCGANVALADALGWKAQFGL